MRSRQRKTFKLKDEFQTTTASPPPPQRSDHSKSRHDLFKQAQNQASVDLDSRQYLQKLVKENKELKKQIIQLKVHQFYNFDDTKLKQLIQQVQSLRKHVKKYQQQIHQLQMQNDFLTRTNVHLKRELQKQIQHRKKSVRKEDARLTHGKQSDHTLNTDCSRNNQEEISHLTYISSNGQFLQNITLQDSKDILRGMDYQSGTHEPSQQKIERHPRKSLMQKILSPRRGKQKSPLCESNQYLLYRRQKDKRTVLY